MPFKSHPYYDHSEADDWLDHIHGDQQPTPLFQFLMEHEKELFTFALERIKKHAGEDDLQERPYAEVNTFLYHPLGGHGFRAYIEYAFFQKTNENRPDSDFWWVIIIWPYALSPSPPPCPKGQRPYNVIAIGWTV
jgi:hypothetical protein